MSRSPFVLVHGAWHGGWCWRRLTPLLAAAGHPVLAVTLTGLGERAHLAHPGIDLATHIVDLAAMLEAEDLNDAILVGHSYGGMVIAGAAARCPGRLRRLVYLDAMVPDPGQSAFDLNSPGFRVRLEREAAESADGYRFPPMPAEVLGVTEPALAAWVGARLVPQPIATFRQPLPAEPPAPPLPATFIRCARFGFIETAARCRQMGWPVLEIESGHDAMLTHPHELAAILLGPDCR